LTTAPGGQRSCYATGPARRATEWTPADGRKKEVDQRRLGDQHYIERSTSRGVSWSEKETMAADRVRWRNLLPIVPEDLSAK